MPKYILKQPKQLATLVHFGDSFTVRFIALNI